MKKIFFFFFFLTSINAFAVCESERSKAENLRRLCDALTDYTKFNSAVASVVGGIKFGPPGAIAGGLAVGLCWSVYTKDVCDSAVHYNEVLKKCLQDHNALQTWSDYHAWMASLKKQDGLVEKLADEAALALEAMLKESIAACEEQDNKNIDKELTEFLEAHLKSNPGLSDKEIQEVMEKKLKELNEKYL